LESIDIVQYGYLAYLSWSMPIEHIIYTVPLPS
jgi:hypothetical protein